MTQQRSDGDQYRQYRHGQRHRCHGSVVRCMLGVFLQLLKFVAHIFEL
jgi:hypothetical protein